MRIEKRIARVKNDGDCMAEILKEGTKKRWTVNCELVKTIYVIRRRRSSDRRSAKPEDSVYHSRNGPRASTMILWNKVNIHNAQASGTL